MIFEDRYEVRRVLSVSPTQYGEALAFSDESEALDVAANLGHTSDVVRIAVIARVYADGGIDRV